MNFNYLLLVASIVFLVSCKKDPLPELPDTNEPYYSVRGLVNGDSINWVVGVNQTTITHGVSEMNGVQNFYGQINSLPDEMALKIEILRPEIIFDGTSIDAISGSQLSFLVHKPGAVKFNFGINYGQLNYLLVKNEMNEYVMMDHVEFSEFGIHNVGLKFTDFGSESFTLPVKYGFEEQELVAGFNSFGDGNILTVNPETLEGTHQWILDGLLVSEESSFTQEMANGIYTLTHKLTDENENVSEYTTLIRFSDNNFNWQLKYFYVPPVQPSSNYGCVTVSVLKDGVWYSSSKASANLDYKFNVSNIETVIDSNYEPMWTMFDFVFQSTLYNESQSDSLYLPEMIGSLNVALK